MKKSGKGIRRYQSEVDRVDLNLKRMNEDDKEEMIYSNNLIRIVK